jgi:hypothetical protein
MHPKAPCDQLRGDTLSAMTEPAAPSHGGTVPRVLLLVLAVVAHLTGWSISGFGLIAYVFGAPVDPLAILVIGAIAAVVLLAVVVAAFPLSRATRTGASRWWVALIGAVVVIAGWVVANVLIVDIGLNP